MSADARSAAYHDAPTVTPEREQLWREWKDNYLVSCAEGWVTQGGDRTAIMQAGAVVWLDLAKVDDLPWMPLGLAMTHHINYLLSRSTESPLQGDEQTEYINALRTRETATEPELVLASAYFLGVSEQQSANLRDEAREHLGWELGSKGRTALYRHYDERGALLYIGITKTPGARATQHGQKSKWFRFVADTQIEWFATFAAAEMAERAAIHDETPVFNYTHNRLNRAAAMEYLFAAIGDQPRDEPGKATVSA